MTLDKGQTVSGVKRSLSFVSILEVDFSLSIFSQQILATETSCLFDQTENMASHITAISAKYACPLVGSINFG